MSAAKRRADKQITRDDLDDLDRDDSPDRAEPERGFQAATPEVLQQRTIRKARRTVVGETPVERASPFAGLLLNRGGDKPASAAFAAFAKYSSNAPTTSTLAMPSISTAGPSATLSKPPAPTNGIVHNTCTDSKDPEDTEYHRKLKALNTKFKSWVCEYLTDGSCYNFSNVCKEYINYAEKLAEQYPVELVPAGSEKTSEQPKAAESKLISQSSSQDKPSGLLSSQASSIGVPPAKMFQFGVASSGASSQPSFGGFSSQLTTPGKPFGKPAFSSTPLGSTLLAGTTFGKIPALPLSQPGQSTVAEPKESNQDDEEPYEPPKAEVLTVEEEGAIYSKQGCKLYHKGSVKYEVMGKGTIHVKELDGGKKQLLFRAENSLGTIWINTLLAPCLFSVQKKDVFVTVPSTDGKADLYLIRAGSADEATEIEATLKKHK